MSDNPPSQPPGWYPAQGDPPGTHRFWDGTQWQGGPQPISGPGPTPTAAGGGASGDLAGPGQRVLARLIDLVIWFVIALVFAVVVGGGASNVGTEASGASFIAGLLSTLVIAGIEVWFVANKGGTPGKMVLNLRVADEATGTSPVDYKTSGMRVIPLVLGIIPVVGGCISLIIGIISLVLLFTDAKRQTVWDKIAKTVVVRA